MRSVAAAEGQVSVLSLSKTLAVPVRQMSWCVKVNGAESTARLGHPPLFRPWGLRPAGPLTGRGLPGRRLRGAVRGTLAPSLFRAWLSAAPKVSQLGILPLTVEREAHPAWTAVLTLAPEHHCYIWLLYSLTIFWLSCFFFFLLL